MLAAAVKMSLNAFALAVLSGSVALTGCGGGGSSDAPAAAAPAPTPAQGAAPWPAPANPLRLTVAAGLRPERKENFTNHVHAHLDVFVNGAPVVVPAGIGINTDDPGVKTLKAEDGSTGYGRIDLCEKPCISPLHTHFTDGILHTESAVAVPNTLGQFFTQWDVRLSPSCVGGYCHPTSIQIFVDGKRFDGDPRAIELTDRAEIAIVIGTPPADIPFAADFSNA